MQQPKCADLVIPKHEHLEKVHTLARAKTDEAVLRLTHVEKSMEDILPQEASQQQEEKSMKDNPPPAASPRSAERGVEGVLLHDATATPRIQPGLRGVRALRAQHEADAAGSRPSSPRNY